MATKSTIKNISVRKNRDYSKDFAWNEELNRNLYKFYLQARGNHGSDGYINQLKRLWDEEYEQFSHLSKNNLAQQARHIERRLRKGSQREATTEIPQTTTSTPPPTTTTALPESVETDNDSFPSVATTGEDRVDNVNDIEVRDELKSTFMKYYEQFKNLELNTRNYTTKINFKVEQSTIDTLNDVIEEFKSSIPDISFWEINVICYASALTLMERHGKLRENKHTKKDAKKGWEFELTAQINTTRRKISQIQLVLKCIENKQYTKKQKTVAAQVKRACGNLEPLTLNSKLAVLKHNLKVKNTKLKDMRTKAERSRINYQFVNNQKQVYRTWKSKQIEVTNPPSTESIKDFWSGIWQKDT